MKFFNYAIEKEFERMRQRMKKMFGSLSPPGAAAFQSATGWRPLLDLYETTIEQFQHNANAGKVNTEILPQP
jgi:hypothetical protein